MRHVVTWSPSSSPNGRSSQQPFGAASSVSWGPGR
jgi:hypothetical protein